MPKRADTLFKVGNSLKLDVFSVLGPEETSYYQYLIGVMRWMIEIGRIDINTKVFLLSSHSVLPRQGHLKAVLLIMGCLKLRHNSRLASYPNINHSNFQDFDWTDFYEGAVETFPPNAPLPRGKEVDLCMFVNSNHAGYK